MKPSSSIRCIKTLFFRTKQTRVFFLIFLPFILISNSFSQDWQHYDTLRAEYQAKGVKDSMLLYGEKALQSVKDSIGENDTLYAEMLNKMLIANFIVRDYVNAVKYGEKERQVRLNTQGRNSLRYASTSNNLAELYRALGRYPEAIEIHEEVREIRAEIIGKENNDYATTCNHLALAYFMAGNYESSEKLYLEAKEVREKIGITSTAAYATTLTYLSVLYETLGRYDEAVPLYIEAMSVREEVYGKMHPEYASICHNFASLHWRLGNYDEALRLYMQAKEIYENTWGKENANYANTIDNIAIILNMKGDFYAAEMMFKEVNEIRERVIGKNHPDYATGLINLANLYSSLGKRDAVVELYMQAKKTLEVSLGKEHPTYATMSNNLGLTYQGMKKFEEAEKLLLEALNIREKNFGKYHSLYASTLGNLASLYYDLEDFDKAEKLYFENLYILEQVLGNKHVQYAQGCRNIALLYIKKKRYEEAEQLMLKEREIILEVFGDNHYVYCSNTINMGWLYHDMQRFTEAEELFLEGIYKTNNMLVQNFSFLSESEKEQYFKLYDGAYDLFYSFAYQRKDDSPSITASTYNIVIRNKGLLLKSSTAMRLAIQNSNDSELISMYENWVELRKNLSVLYTTEVLEITEDIKDLERKVNDLEKELVVKSGIFSDFERDLNVSWTDVRDNLNSGEAAIEFVKFEKWNSEEEYYYAALVITPDIDFPKMIGLFLEKDLELIIQELTDNDLANVNTIYGTLEKPEQKLYNLVWKPMEDVLKDIQKVYLSPVGLLHKVSFASIANDKNILLCNVYDIYNLSSTVKLVRPEEFTLQQGQNAVLFGGVNYNSDRSTKEVWKYLEGTKQEINSISEILNKNGVVFREFTDNNSTKKQFEKSSAGAHIIHIATHGFFYPDPNESKRSLNQTIIQGEVDFRGTTGGFGSMQLVSNPNPLMRSGIALTGANIIWNDEVIDDTDNGVLTSQEIINLNFQNSGLVVLSACETGLGDIKGSEGVYGLQRAFKMAGAKNLIMSLWQVPDKETVEFMTSFYSLLFEYYDTRKAFNETQRIFSQKYDPFFWAAFVLLE